MPRQALLVANTVDFQGRAGDQSKALVDRMLGRFEGILSQELPEQFRFVVKTLRDSTPSQVRDALETRAVKAHESEALLLFYYFGHGALNRHQQLQFVYPGEKRGQAKYQLLTSLEGVVNETALERSLFILDCCYAGAADRAFPTTLGAEHYRMASTTPQARAWVDTGRPEDPIGFFSRAVMDGFVARQACDGMTDSITAASLFKYAKERTSVESEGVQTPTQVGQLSEPLSEYVVKPPTVTGIADDANEKSAYRKILALILALNKVGTAEDIEHLKRLVVRDYPESFKTLHKGQDGVFRYLPVRPQVVGRYIRFLRRLHIVSPDELTLTPSGKKMARNSKARFGADLLDAVDMFLQLHGLDRATIRKAPQSILSARGVPTQAQVTTYLGLVGGRVSREDLGIILTILGCCRDLRVSPSTAYFSW